MVNQQKYSDIQNTRTPIVKSEDVKKCIGFENLSNEQAQMVAESLRLFCEILADVYFMSGTIK